MHVNLIDLYQDSAAGQEASDIISACVHCGFCLATCPTYLDSRDERDSPRGRIYLIKQLLETGEASQTTHLHLDRCLTCRNCETTCPSGVRYGRLVDIGRGLMEQKVVRATPVRAIRYLLRKTLSSPKIFGFFFRIGQVLRPLLPGFLKSKISPRQALRSPPQQQHSRKMLILEGCAQSSATPATNIAVRRVLDKLGICASAANEAGCCGAVNYHLAAHDDGLNDVRRNIDAWWPAIEAGAEAIVSSASGCGAMLVEYGDLLAHDPHYAQKARRVSQLSRDISEILLEEDLAPLKVDIDVGRVAVHTPCTLQHALKLPDAIPEILAQLGFELVKTNNSHLCCGSAGTYSILQSSISNRLKNNKLADLCIDQPDLIATGNVGCQLHLGADSKTPVCHWIELLDGD